MNARQKLNIAYLQGAVLLSVAIGMFVNSWIVFLATLALFVGAGLYVGDIRLPPRQ